MSKRESFGSTMDAKLLSELRNISEDTGIPISKLLDRAVQALVNEKDKYLFNGNPNKDNIKNDSE